MTPKCVMVRNLKRYQHYKDRRPPWVKLYQSILDDRGFCTLPDSAKWHFIGLILVASRLDNHIPTDSLWLRRTLHSNAKVDIGALVRAELIAPCKQHAISETETENEAPPAPW